MGRLDNFMTIPIGSLLMLSEAESDPYFDKIAAMPAPLKDVMTSVNTGAFVRGLTKAYGLPLEKARDIALVVVRVVTAAVPLRQMAGALSRILPLTAAQKMAQEIERDLFGPVRGELEQYWQMKASGAKKTSPAPPVPPTVAGTPNVLNLKERPRLLPPPPMPRG